MRPGVGPRGSRGSRRGQVALLALLAGAAVGAQEPDDRSRELLRLDCRSSAGRRDLTLFANGTVRGRSREGVQPLDLRLAQLREGELDDLRRRLEAVDLSESTAARPDLDGYAGERCGLSIDSGGRPDMRFDFGSLDSLSLAQRQLLDIVQELENLLETRKERTLGFPPDYAPRTGDVLRRHDGELYAVVTLTVDGQGVELQGVEQPLTLFVALDGLQGEFVELVRRGRRPGR